MGEKAADGLSGPGRERPGRLRTAGVQPVAMWTPKEEMRAAGESWEPIFTASPLARLILILAPGA